MNSERKEGVKFRKRTNKAKCHGEDIPLMTLRNMSDEESDSNSDSARGHEGMLSTIQDFVETTIVLKKDKELGISIVGGSDTYLQAICVAEIHEDGAAIHDGRLRRGDQILSVNDMRLHHMKHLQAVEVLREAISPIRLTILRENPEAIFTCTEEPKKFVTIEVAKPHPFSKLGISLLGRKDGRGVFVTWVKPESPSGRSNIKQGDRILEINGQDVRRWPQKKIANVLRTTGGPVVLLLGRYPELRTAIQEYAKGKMFPTRERSGTWCGQAQTSQIDNLPSYPSDMDAHSDTCLRINELENVKLLSATKSPNFPRARANTEVGWKCRLRAGAPGLPMRTLGEQCKPTMNSDVTGL